MSGNRRGVSERIFGLMFDRVEKDRASLRELGALLKDGAMQSRELRGSSGLRGTNIVVCVKRTEEKSVQWRARVFGNEEEWWRVWWSKKR